MEDAVIVPGRQMGMTHQLLLDVEWSLFSSEERTAGLPANAAKSLLYGKATTSAVDRNIGLSSTSWLRHGADLAGKRPTVRTT